MQPTITAKDGTQLDGTVVNLARAIRKVESGNSFTAKGASGENGGYQFMPDTWKGWAGKHLGDPNAEMTPVNQDKVAYYQIKEWKDKGYSPAQIASMWNAGETRPNAFAENWKGTVTLADGKKIEYDTPAYVNKVINEFRTVKATAPVPQQETQQPTPAIPQNTYGALFPSKPTDSPLTAGVKAIANTPSSVINLGKDIAGAVLNPIQTLKGIGAVAVGGAEKLAGNTTENTEVFDSFLGALKQRYGGTENLQATATNDPFGFGGDVLSIIVGGASAVGKGAQVSSALSKTARTVAGPVDSTIAKAGNIAGEVTKTAVSKLSGVEPSTISQVMKSPELFTAEQLSNTSRIDIAKAVKDALDTRLDTMKETGQAYAPIRSLQSPNLDVADITTKAIKQGDRTLVYNLQDAPNELLSLPELRKKVQLLSSDANSPAFTLKDAKAALTSREAVETVPFSVKVKKTHLEKELKEVAGIDVKNGKLIASGTSKIREARDVAALQKTFDLWKPVFARGKMTSEEFLNFRSDMARLAKLDREVSKSADLENLSAIMRGRFNTAYRDQVPNLKQLDETFTAQSSEYNRLRDGLLDKEGNLTDAAINKIANATGKGKDKLLERLEEILPGVTHRIKVLKAVEDIQAAQGNKVGTYTQAMAATGAIVGGLSTGSLQLLASGLAMAILATPEVAVPLLRQFGMQKQLVSQVLKNLNSSGVLTANAAVGANATARVGQLTSSEATAALEPAL